MTLNFTDRETQILARLYEIRARHASALASSVNMSSYDPERIRALCDAPSVDEIVQEFSASASVSPSAAPGILVEHLEYAIFAREVALESAAPTIRRLIELRFRT
jgi:hypothetical protein